MSQKRIVCMCNQYADLELCSGAGSLLGNLDPKLVLIKQVAKVPEI
jgi:hypothetical protein